MEEDNDEIDNNDLMQVNPSNSVLNTCRETLKRILNATYLDIPTEAAHKLLSELTVVESSLVGQLPTKSGLVKELKKPSIKRLPSTKILPKKHKRAVKLLHHVKKVSEPHAMQQQLTIMHAPEADPKV